jgi:peptide/nickel transport system permease protein
MSDVLHAARPGARARAVVRRVWDAPFFRNKVAVVALIVMLILLLMVLMPGLLTARDPLKQDLAASLQPPGPDYLLGADKQGRDIWSRLVYGAQNTLAGAFLVVLLAECIGVPLGLISAYYGGRTESVVMRGVDMVLAFPGLILAILIVSTFGRGLAMSAVSLGVLYSPSIVRLVRSVTLVQKSQAYVEAARAVGFPGRRIVFRHILPNIASPIIVQTSIYLASAILDIAALSYLGLGVQPPYPDWGSMVSEGNSYLLLAPYTALFAGLITAIAVIAINLAGDGLRAQFDPRQRLL